MHKQLRFGNEARNLILNGVKTLSMAVKVTLGPKGRNVCIDKDYGSPSITKDGVTVAKEIFLKDRFENMGACIIKEVAAKTADDAGDGTTTATVLAESIFTKGMQNVANGYNPMLIKRGIEAALNIAVQYIKNLSKEIKAKAETIQIATIASNGDAEIGKIIADALEKVGKDGVITVEEAKSTSMKLEFVEGMQFDNGYISPYFVTNPAKMEVNMEDVYILCHEKRIYSVKDLIPLLDKVVAKSKQLLIITEDMDGEVLETLVVNKMRGVVKICAVRAPGYGDRRKEMLQDIAILTGGKCVDESTDVKLKEIQLSDLGFAKKIKVKKDETTIIEGAGLDASIKERIEQLKALKEESESDYEKEKLSERIGKLLGGVAVINVGAPSEIEMKEKKDRVEDALHATKAAVEEGIVPGGGVALIRAAQELRKVTLPSNDEAIGYKILIEAMEEPLKCIVYNSGGVPELVLEKVKAMKETEGYNADTDKYEDLIIAGVIDPAKVTRQALQNAASIASMLLTTESLITKGEEKEKKGGRFQDEE